LSETFQRKGYSIDRGILEAADHFASAFISNTELYTQRLFQKPNLNFITEYILNTLFLSNLLNRINPILLLSLVQGREKPTFYSVVAKEGSFYTLPFQASINAMFQRVSSDLKNDNPDLDIRLLHSTSSLSIKGSSLEEKMIQGHVGSAIKILTPHQIAGIVFGTSGYEATLIDIKDVISFWMKFIPIPT